LTQGTLPIAGGLDLNVPTFGDVVGASGAFLSAGRRYRYLLWRVWDERPPALFVGLNPSTADEHADDPTIRRCTRFARDWGHGGLLMANLFAWRATNPAELSHQLAPAGELSPTGSFHGRPLYSSRNDIVLCAAHQHAAITVACWGAHATRVDPSRPPHVRGLLDPLHHLGQTAEGHPRHPLYIRADTRPERWT
jgi:hypothetical protein